MLFDYFCAFLTCAAALERIFCFAPWPTRKKERKALEFNIIFNSIEAYQLPHWLVRSPAKTLSCVPLRSSLALA